MSIAGRREFGRRLGPGQVVDLDERLSAGVTLRDVVDESWFESVEPVPVVKELPETEEPSGMFDRIVDALTASSETIVDEGSTEDGD